MTTRNTLLDSISVPVMMLNGDRHVAHANQAALASFTNLETGMSLEKLGNWHGNLDTVLKDAFDDPETARLTLVTNETFQREFLVSVKPLSPADRTTDAKMVLTFIDRTPVRVAKSMRSDFVANVSHEIRSPLTAISGFVETLQSDAQDDPEARALFLGLMGKEVVRMTNLVSDLLSLSKVEAKENRAPKNPLNLNQTILQAVESVTSLAQKHGKQLECRIDPDLPTTLGKGDHLTRALINLLENAINYSCENGVITITAQAAPANNLLKSDAVMIAVQDQGEGIPAKEIPRLTERFYRVDKSRSRNVGGTGLGLAIVKHILVRHRGVLAIESVVGEGSTFTIYLPAAASQHKS